MDAWIIALIVIVSVATVGLVVLLCVLSVRSRHGERGVDKRLNKLEIENKTIISDLIIPYRNSSSQIDNILLTTKAIYVIECKQYHGDIKGNINDKTWYETTYSVSSSGRTWTHAYKMYNPIMQNNTYINALAQLLDVDKKYFVSLVCFLAAYPKLDQPSPNVIRKKELTTKIMETESSIKAKFTLDQYNRMKAILEDYKNNPRVTKKEHVSNVKAKHSEDKMIY